MPLHIDRRDSRHMHGEPPSLILVSPDAAALFPPFDLAGGEPCRCEGWQMYAGLAASRITTAEGRDLRVEGIAYVGEIEDRYQWIAAVSRIGGAVVLCVRRQTAAYDWPALAEEGATRGGFVPLVPSGLR
ncbi:hypothetical protein OIE66_26670 [Nonomuraea sp. NBC_01738]|uniref:hypothetical protein n=1 Tax=Nonomuraea sp. NBC_01738 TaxID=2976003 RepID=UPI002E0D7569|nr:hypothetical protein OIE66_26670 [Nonomuraea sp. NBC_01738]